MRCLLTFWFLSGFAQAQSEDRNRISISGGWARQLYVDPNYRETAPVVGLSYGYRPLKFMEFEAGVAVALQPGLQRNGDAGFELHEIGRAHV